MSIYACIVAGLVVGQLFSPPPGQTIGQTFPPDMTCWADVSAVSPPPQAGWTCAGSPLACAPPAPVATPPSATISTSAFFARFTQAETLGVSAASNASAAINAGLVQGLAAGSVDLTSPVLKAWMDGLAQAGAITATRETAILTP